MEHTMFCYQCEQTSGGIGCTGSTGVCGKPSNVAALQDQLTGTLISLSLCAKRRTHRITKETDGLVQEGLFTTITNVNFDAPSIQNLIIRIKKEQDRICRPNVRCQEFDMHKIWAAGDNERSLKSLILFGLRGMAAYAYHARALGYSNQEVNMFFYKALRTIATEDRENALLGTVLEVGKYNYQCMELLHKANHETFGKPMPIQVSLTIEKGPFIVVTGHDFKELYHLLEATEGTGVSVYTHGEMLPAHGYPELRKFPHLKGHFGTAWQNQRNELDAIQAPILFTTNCLMPPKISYMDRIFTTGPVYYPGTTHLDENSDYGAIIAKAKELRGYDQRQFRAGMNGGTIMETGWSYETIQRVEEQLIDVIQSGKCSHIFLVGGCDGAAMGRSYYTDFVKATPKESIILTLGCGKFRFNDLDLGTVSGIPRILDMGQCNDAYGAIRLAALLADRFSCSINDLPISFILSWYEQKAVSVLLTLLYLGVQNIFLGPSLPACLSENALHILTEHYHLRQISTPEEDLQRILNKE